MARRPSILASTHTHDYDEPPRLVIRPLLPAHNHDDDERRARWLVVRPFSPVHTHYDDDEPPRLVVHPFSPAHTHYGTTNTSTPHTTSTALTKKGPNDGETVDGPSFGA
jgi:hypothetical protein